jgi:hypothetical protein
MPNTEYPGAGVNAALLDALAPTEAGDVAGAEAVTGHLAGVDNEGRLLFRADGSHQVRPVAIAVPLSDEELVRAARLEQRALVLIAPGSQQSGVLVGMLRERVGSEARDAANAAGAVNVKVDGEAVRISAQSEIELRCGKSRLLMHKDGRIEISGNYLISRSRGPVKIKGATIALN